MSIPAELKYAATHEWARMETDGTISVGITHHAQDLLGDMVYVENPQVGRQLSKGEECGVVESVNTALGDQVKSKQILLTIAEAE